jgi:formylglycine-generating enzyme required for sulfatase activity
MHGNVWEWCWDWYGDYESGVQADPVGAVSGDYRVLRGGGWHGNVQNLRAARRDYDHPGLRNEGVGFRVVRP